jgi:type II secretory pathway pseudopilin PulG
MVVAVIVLGVLFVFLLAVLVGHRLYAVRLEEYVLMRDAENAGLRAENAALRGEVEHWKDKHAALWSNVAAGFGQLKKDMGVRSRHIDADAQEGE